MRLWHALQRLVERKLLGWFSSIKIVEKFQILHGNSLIWEKFSSLYFLTCLDDARGAQWFQTAKPARNRFSNSSLLDDVISLFKNPSVPSLPINCWASHSKMCQTVAGIRMISQFPRFLIIKFLAGFCLKLKLCGRMAARQAGGAASHKGLNSPKRFTNLLSGSMSLILN